MPGSSAPFPMPVNPGATQNVPTPPADRSFTVSQAIARGQSRGVRATLNTQFHIHRSTRGR